MLNLTKTRKMKLSHAGKIFGGLKSARYVTLDRPDSPESILASARRYVYDRMHQVGPRIVAGTRSTVSGRASRPAPIGPHFATIPLKQV